jgi:hypothetical protein
MLMIFESHPEAAVLLYHKNSGHMQFPHISKFTLEVSKGTNNDHLEMKILEEQALKEINNEVLTSKEMQQLIEKFASNHGRDTTWSKSPTFIPFCGLCGVRQVQGGDIENIMKKLL